MKPLLIVKAPVVQALTFIHFCLCLAYLLVPLPCLPPHSSKNAQFYLFDCGLKTQVERFPR